MTKRPINPDWASLKRLKRELRRPMKTLYVLSDDPFFVTLARRKAAFWFAKLWKDLGMQPGSHIRRLHYKIISQREPVLNLKGMPYENTEGCWDALSRASKDARYLSLISADDFVDRRNKEAIVNNRDTGNPVLDVDGGDLTMPADMPDLPRAELGVGEQTQRYQIEIWAEKSTMNDILEPIAAHYGVTLVAATGEISLTHCNLCVERAKEDRRPVRILYISDFDPGGRSMPVGAARKIEFFARLAAEDGDDDLDIQLHPVVLTPEQCQHYRLPRTPIKEGERRAERFEDRFGAGATELDALEALYPGELERIVRREIERYFDTDLNAETEAQAYAEEVKLDEITDRVHHEHAYGIESLREEYADLVAAHARWKARAEPLWEAITEEIEAEAEPIIVAVEWPEPKDGDEYDDPLYDSSRDYLTQINKYKVFQGKEKECVDLSGIDDDEDDDSDDDAEDNDEEDEEP